MSEATRRTPSTPGWAGPLRLLLFVIVALATLLVQAQAFNSSVVVGAGKQQEGLGNFYPTERSSNRDYRWTNEVSRINTPRLSYAQQITLYLDGSRPPTFAPSAIDIVVNGRPAATIPATAGPITYTFTYHDLNIAPELSLEIRPQQTFYPSDKDYRKLGVIYYGMQTQPAPGPLAIRWPPLMTTLLWLLLALCLYAIAGKASQSIRFNAAAAQTLSPMRSGWQGAIIAFAALILLAVLLLIAAPATLIAWLAVGVVVLLPLAIFLNRTHVEAALSQTGNWLTTRKLWQIRALRVLAIPFFYLIATIIFTWPYVLSFGSRLPGWPMDNFNFMYKIWWVSHALFGNPPPGSSIVFNPNVYYPVGFNLSQGELTPANTLATIPITATLGPIVSYNFLVFLSFVISGWSMYLLVKYLLDNGGGPLFAPADNGGAQGAINMRPYEPAPELRTPNSTLIALLIGLAFTFLPYRLNHMLGHLQMLGTQWLPLTFLFLEKMLRRRRWQDGALAGLFFALCCWEAWYYAAIIGLFVGLYIPIRWWQLRERTSHQPSAAPTLALTALRPPSQSANVKTITAFVLVTAALVLPFAIPYLALRSGNSLAYTVKAANGSSALLSDYFIPSQLHPLWGNIFKTAHTANLNLTEYNLWPGAAMYLLIGLGCWAGWKWRGKLAGFPFSLYLGMALLAVVLSFGLKYDLSGELSRFNPALRNETWQVPLPGLLLYDHVPLFSSIRAWARFGIIVLFAFYVVAALGLAWLLLRPRFRAYRYTVVAALAVIILADFWATPYTWGFSRVEEQPLDAYLAALPGQPVIAMMPIDRSTRDGPAMWASVYHGKPIAYGYETFMPNDYQRNEDTLLNFPKAPAFDVLKGWNVSYIAVSSSFYGHSWPEIRDDLAANSRLKFIQTFHQHAIWDGDVGLFDIRPDIAWHATSDEVYLYQLLRLPLPNPPRCRGRGIVGANGVRPYPRPTSSRGRRVN